MTQYTSIHHAITSPWCASNRVMCIKWNQVSSHGQTCVHQIELSGYPDSIWSLPRHYYTKVNKIHF